jgi:uncharacterized protein YggU (UPF0235/DUF167 family)
VTARFRLEKNGVTFHVRLTPKGGRDAIEGWAMAADGLPHLKVRVRAVPEDGKANAALLALLAKELRLAKSAFALVAGSKARLKTVAVTGDTAHIAARLEGFGEA